jgi:hypothetical protein
LPGAIENDWACCCEGDELESPDENTPPVAVAEMIEELEPTEAETSEEPATLTETVLTE